MWKQMVLALALSLTVMRTGAECKEISPVGLNQKTLVICVRYKDALTTRMANCSDWISLLSNEVNTFYNKATYSQTNFQFETISGQGAPANGWLDLGVESKDYNLSKTGQIAINLADPFANFSNYNRVVVITSWPKFGGQTSSGPYWWAVDEGAEATTTPAAGGTPAPCRAMTLTFASEWLAHSYGNSFDEAGAVVAHELGHQLGAPTHYGSINFAPDHPRDTISPWDIMGLSPTLNHFIGYVKTNRGWILPGPRIKTLGPPAPTIDETITLRPLEQSTASSQIIRIPFTSSQTFIGYVVENRRKINGDEQLPSAGVLVSAVDESPNSVIRAFVIDDPDNPYDLSQSPLDVGDAFTDPAHKITVKVLSQSGKDFNVRVKYDLPLKTFDPAIIAWGAPPWETPDIWIDSERNKFDTYHYKDANGNPIGNGDNAWVDHDNRVYVRVHNYGSGKATNVKVQLYVNSPPGMGDAGPNWDFVGVTVFPTINAGDDAKAYLLWKPTKGKHTCLKAVIVDTPGEIVTSNNLAQENVTHFDTKPGSVFEAVHLNTMVNNPFDVELPVHMNVRDVPYGWGVVIEPEEMRIQPHSQHPVDIAVYPSGLPSHEADGTPAERSATAEGRIRPVKWDPMKLRETGSLGFIGKPKIEALMPFYDTFVPIGGIDIWTHLTHTTYLTCRIAGSISGETHVTNPLNEAISAKENAGLMPRRSTTQTPRTAVNFEPTQLYRLGAIVLEPKTEPRVPHGRAVIEGEIMPAIQGATIAVELKNGSTRRMEFATTDENGKYRLRINSEMAGRVVAQSFYAGDVRNAEAESGYCAFTIESR